MRFHPKSLASTDHMPGPIIAKATPTVANRILTHGSVDLVAQIPRIATIVPVTGVHKPARRSSPAMIASSEKNENPACNLNIERESKAAAVMTRNSKRPTPGQP
jgi:hypothetical protein